MDQTNTQTKFHLIRRTTIGPDGEGTNVILFARFDNGMIIGGAQDDRAQFGEQADKVVTHIFVDHDCAVAWVKQQCRLYAGREDVDFIERSEEQKIIVPRGPLPKVRMQ